METRSGCAASRDLLDQLMDKWSVMVLYALCNGPLRFNALKHELGGVTQKSLTQCLRRLERHGVVERRVIPASPVAVEYEMTALGRSLSKLFASMYVWTQEHMAEVDRARAAYDARYPLTQAA